MNDSALVCVIDDDAFARLQVCGALLLRNIRTIAACDGEEGLKALSRAGGAVRVAVVDILMPEKDGFETIMEAKSLYPELKIIAVSDGGVHHSANELLLTARQLGADACMRKPLQLDQLVDEIEAMCQNEAPRRAAAG